MRELILRLYGDPDIDVREVKQGDTKEIIEDKLDFPFMARQRSFLHLYYGEEEYVIHNPVPYKYDGASIPFGLCKGDTRLLVPAMFHDIVTKDTYKIGYNRFLSSLMYYKLLRMHGVGFLWAIIQFILVDFWQFFQSDWKRNK